MTRLPALSGPDLVKLLRKDGFEIVRQKGSHVSMKKGEHKTVVPLHSDLAKGTIIGILKQCGLSKEDLQKLIDSN